MTDILVTNLEPINKGALLYKCDAEIASLGLVIREVKLFQKGENSWVGMPSRQFEKDGEKRYKNLVTFNESDVANHIRDAILKAVEKAVAERTDDVPF